MVSRRKFLSFLAGAAGAVAVPALLVPNRSFFLPPPGGWPSWPHSQSWGYAPFGGVGLLLIILLVLVLSGRL